jgi:transposase
LCNYQHRFDNLYLFGAFSPINGNHLILEMPQCNSNMFQTFLDELSKQDEKEFKIVILDNGAFHHARSLSIPDNMELVFLPPYSPELNPAEKVWWVIKRELKMKLFKTINELQDAITNAVKKICTHQTIKQLTAFAYYNNIF